MGRFLAFLCCLLLTALVPAGSARAQAQVGSVGDPLTVCVTRADPAASARALFAGPARFDCRTPQRDFGSGDFDVLSAPLAEGTGAAFPAHVRFGSVWQAGATLYALYADGAVTRVPLSPAGLSRAVQLGAMADVRLPFRGVPVARLLWRIEGSANIRGIVLAPRMATAMQGWRSNMLLAAIYAAYGGLCTALMIYNLALWGALRRPFQLAYCAMIATLMLYALSSSGALAWWWPGLDNNDRLRINYLTLGMSAASALAFARSFFEPEVFAGWTGRLVRGVIAALLGSSLLFAALAPWQVRLLDRLYAFSFVALLAVVVPVMVRAWRVRSNFLWLFALAWGAPILFAALRTAASLGLMPWSFWIDNSTVLAMIAESLLSSIAIAYRIHLLSRERDEAREQEIAARLLADTDPLTALLNRRAFLSRAIGREGEQTLVIVDIDHFKRVNDTIGHDGGDEVLRIVARVLRGAAGGGAALVARLGGEEFAILTPADEAADPRDLLDALRGARMPFDLTVTASIGTCTGLVTREADWKQLYRCADRALFAAKTAGRDRVRDAAALSVAA